IATQRPRAVLGRRWLAVPPCECPQRETSSRARRIVMRCARPPRGAEMAVMIANAWEIIESAARGPTGQSPSGGRALPRVAVISDTVEHIDGTAIGLRRLVAASRRAGHAITLIGPAGQRTDDDLVRIPAAMTAALPIYPSYAWSVPELPRLVEELAKHADLV